MKEEGMTKEEFHQILEKASKPLIELQLLAKMKKTDAEIIALEEKLDKAKAIVIVCKRLYELETGGDAIG